MMLFVALPAILFSLQAVPLAGGAAIARSARTDLLTIEAPDVHINKAFEHAKKALAAPIVCHVELGCEETSLTGMAVTALGDFAPARQGLTSHADSSAAWIMAAHAYWTASGDAGFLAPAWTSLSVAYDSVTNDTTHSTSVLLMHGLLAQERADSLLDDLLASGIARWPFATGFLAVASYQYHRDREAFSLLEMMAAQQYSSAPLFVLAVARGLVGWHADARYRAAAFEPHVPADWKTFNVRNLKVGKQALSARIIRERGAYAVHLQRLTAGAPLSLRVAPALPRGARVRSVTVNERDVPIHVEQTAHDVHVVIELSFRREADIEIEYEIRTGK